jgi:hypothetical protein
MGEINFYVDGSVEGWTATVLNIPKDGKNHDGWLIKNGNIIVADGSTPLGDDWPQDLRKWVGSILNLISEYGKAPEVPLIQAWGEAVETNNTLFKPAGWKRTCYISHVRISYNVVETLTVGDVKLAFMFKDGTVEEVFDSRLESHEKREDALIAEEAKTTLEAALTNRAKVNTADGYYAVADDPKIGSHAISKNYNTLDVVSLIIASDGFWRLFSSASDMFQATNTDDVIEIMESIESSGEIVDDLTFIRLNRN